MTKRLALLTVLVGFFSACSPNTETPIKESRDADILYVEFLQSCEAKREYETLRRSGQLSIHCKCIFDTTMKSLSENERIVAALYLYGE